MALELGIPTCKVLAPWAVAEKCALWGALGSACPCTLWLPSTDQSWCWRWLPSAQFWLQWRCCGLSPEMSNLGLKQTWCQMHYENDSGKMPTSHLGNICLQINGLESWLFLALVCLLQPIVSQLFWVCGVIGHTSSNFFFFARFPQVGAISLMKSLTRLHACVCIFCRVQRELENAWLEQCKFYATNSK